MQRGPRASSPTSTCRRVRGGLGILGMGRPVQTAGNSPLWSPWACRSAEQESPCWRRGGGVQERGFWKEPSFLGELGHPEGRADGGGTSETELGLL